MKSITKRMKIFFCGILISIFITSFSSIKSQSNFIRDDNFDIQGMHELIAITNPNDFKLFIKSDSDFPFFKLHIRKQRLNLIDITGPWYAGRYKVVIDGNTVQNWSADNEKTISYTFPNPSCISANHTFSFQIDYYDENGNQITTLYDDVLVTIFAKPRVYKDSDNNSFFT
ncbi:MAG: hypothetical protein STSR0008_18460 [Ignavibacterium sp.]